MQKLLITLQILFFIMMIVGMIMFLNAPLQHGKFDKAFIILMIGGFGVVLLTGFINH